MLWKKLTLLKMQSFLTLTSKLDWNKLSQTSKAKNTQQNLKLHGGGGALHEGEVTYQSFNYT